MIEAGGSDLFARIPILTARGWSGADPKYVIRALKQLDGDMTLLPMGRKLIIIIN